MKPTVPILAFLFLLSWTSLIAQSGVIKGRVTNALNNEPIMFANVLVLGTEKGTTTDIEGNYAIEGLEPGLYNVRFTYIGFEERTEYEVQVINNRPAEVNVQLQEQTAELEEVVVRAAPFKKTEESPVSLRTIGVAEIQRNPGGNRDISRVVQTLPGVTTSASFRNDLIIRGGAPNENRFFLDEVEVPVINHFATQGASGGPVGMINVNFIREVDFYSGAFPANRGNALSSVFDFAMRDGRDDRLGGTFMVGASDIGLTLEGPIGDKATFLLSARRSYLQFLFQALGLPFLPTYNDFQAKVKYKIDKRNELTFIGLGAIDQFALNLDANETEEQQFLLAQLPVSPQWNYTTGLVYKHYTDNGYWTAVASRSMLNNESEKYLDNDDSDPDNLILRYASQEMENKLRLEHTTRFDGFKVNFGVGYQFVRYTNSTFNQIFTSSGPQTINFSSAIDFHKYALFGTVSRKLLQDRLILAFGMRVDGNSYSGEMQNPLEHFSPRFSLALALSERLSFNFNTGRYYQLPPYTILGYQEEGVLVTRYEPPRGFSPASLRYIRQMYYDNKTMTAAILSLAVKGYLRINDLGSKHTLFKLDPGADAPPLATGEAELYEALFREGKRVVLEPDNHALLGDARGAHRASLVADYKKHYFRLNTMLNVPSMLIALAATGLAILVGGRISFTMIVAIVVMFLVAVFFGFIMRRPTLRGRKVLDELLGFKDYLEVAEKDEMNLRNPPEKTPQLFEAYLPFALALGVEQDWAEKFAAVLEGIRGPDGHGYQPSWYSGSWNSSNIRANVGSVSGGLGSAISSSVTPPGSSSGGGGGGFSGGGGGGGGGGGW